MSSDIQPALFEMPGSPPPAVFDAEAVAAAALGAHWAGTDVAADVRATTRAETGQSNSFMTTAAVSGHYPAAARHIPAVNAEGPGCGWTPEDPAIPLSGAERTRRYLAALGLEATPTAQRRPRRTNRR